MMMIRSVTKGVSLGGGIKRKNPFQIRYSSSSYWPDQLDISWPANNARSSKEGGGKNNATKKETIEVMSKKVILERLVTEHVRYELPRKLPMTFSGQSSSKVLLSHDEKTVGGTMETLAKLNGYEQIGLPTQKDIVFLAEGITVQPDFYDRHGSPTKNIFMFVQPIDEYAYPNHVSPKVVFPQLIEDDIRLYRILENLAESIITSTYNSIRQTILKRIINPLDSFTSRLIGRKKEPKMVVAEPQIQSTTPTQSGEQPAAAPDQLRNIIVLGSDGAVLFTHMSPSVYLLGLPHTMGHKSASTLLSVSLVVFGAVPLAYRSFRFAMDLQEYPFVSKTVAASVLGTIMYHIWSGRSTSRTRQSDVVSQGMAKRIYARDDAVLWTLREGAIQRVSKVLIQTYYKELNNTTTRGSRIRTSMKKSPDVSIPFVDATQLLIRLGLLLPLDGKEDGKRVPVNLDTAIATLKSRLKENHEEEDR